MTHSPGPWRLAKSGQIVDVNNRAIARIWNTSKRDQDLANGNLIANAPTHAMELRKWREVFGHLGTPDEAGNTLIRKQDELTAHADELLCMSSDLREALALCVRAIDNLLPGARHIPADIGLINEALLKARSLVGDV